MNQDKLLLVKSIANGSIMTKALGLAERSAMTAVLTEFDAMQVKLWQIELLVSKGCVCYDDNTCTACEVLEILEDT